MRTVIVRKITPFKNAKIISQLHQAILQQVLSRKLCQTMQGIFIFGTTVALSLVLRSRRGAKEKPISGVGVAELLDASEVALSLLVTRRPPKEEALSGVVIAELLPCLDDGGHLAAFCTSQEFWLKYIPPYEFVITAKKNANQCFAPVPICKTW